MGARRRLGSTMSILVDICLFFAVIRAVISHVAFPAILQRQSRFASAFYLAFASFEASAFSSGSSCADVSAGSMPPSSPMASSMAS